jgi:hypothetical protein
MILLNIIKVFRLEFNYLEQANMMMVPTLL